MSKQTQKSALWNEELKKGFSIAIMDRLEFHNSLPVNDIVNNTGFSLTTVLKHLKKLEKEKKIKITQTPNGKSVHLVK